MRYYLAYGSNLNKEQMSHRCPDAVPVGTAEIPGYELVFRRGYLTIEPTEDNSVPVGVWEISDSDEKRLDRYEGFPRFYYKKNFDVLCEDGKNRSCMAYIMTNGHPIQEPSSDYIRTVNKGYKDFKFGDEKWQKLFLAHMKAKFG